MRDSTKHKWPQVRVTRNTVTGGSHVYIDGKEYPVLRFECDARYDRPVVVTIEMYAEVAIGED